MYGDRPEKIVFEEQLSQYKYDVWCDLSEEQLKSVDGVDDVIKMSKHHFIVMFDHRYSPHKTKENITRLAEGW